MLQIKKTSKCPNKLQNLRKKTMKKRFKADGGMFVEVYELFKYLVDNKKYKEGNLGKNYPI